MDIVKETGDCSHIEVSDINNRLERDNNGCYGTLTDEEIITLFKDAENINGINKNNDD